MFIMNKEFYLDDYSMEDILKKLNFKENNSNSSDENSSDDISDNPSDDDISSDESNKKSSNKPTFTMKPNYNNKGEKVVVFSINIPLRKNGLKIDILINNEMYKNIGKHLKK